jgi:hypothetical protein
MTRYLYLIVGILCVVLAFLLCDAACAQLPRMSASGRSDRPTPVYHARLLLLAWSC